MRIRLVSSAEYKETNLSEKMYRITQMASGLMCIYDGADKTTADRIGSEELTEIR